MHTMIETSTTFTIVPNGPFSLQELATFGFGQRQQTEWDGVMRLAFRLDGTFQPVGVALTQGDGESVRAAVLTIPRREEIDVAGVKGQVARMLSLDHDGNEFLDVGRRDPVIGELQSVAPGFRPPLFHSPYEAAAWAVLSARRPTAQMMRLRAQLSDTHGVVFQLAGERVAAFPSPDELLSVASFPGLSEEKIRRLHGVARAALDGALDAEYLVSLGAEAAHTRLQELAGIGPFYASLIVIRACGFTDVLAFNEPRALAAVRDLYGLEALPSPAELEVLTEAWRPFRTWVLVLIRRHGQTWLRRSVLGVDRYLGDSGD
jgi:DNA-3-methyladenine glycosylase II